MVDAKITPYKVGEKGEKANGKPNKKPNKSKAQKDC